MKGAKAAPKSVKSAKGTITKGKGKSNGATSRKGKASSSKNKSKGEESSEEEEFGFVLYEVDGMSVDTYYCDHDVLREMKGVILSGSLDRRDPVVKKMVAALQAEGGVKIGKSLDGLRERYKATADKVEERWRVKRENNYDGEDADAVLFDFIQVFGTKSGDDETDLLTGATVTAVAYNGDVGLNGEEADFFWSSKDEEDFGMAVFFSEVCEDPEDERTTCFICKDDLLRDYSGLIMEGSGEFLTDNSVQKMVAQLENRAKHEANLLEKGERSIDWGLSRQMWDDKTRVLIDFVTVFGWKPYGGETVTSCVHTEYVYVSSPRV